MNIYRVRTGRLLHSFQDSMGECPVLGVPLRIFQEEACRSGGLRLLDVADSSQVPDEDCFTFEDDLLFTGAYVQECLRLSAGSSTNLEFRLAENSFNLRYLFPCSSTEEVPWAQAFRFRKRASSAVDVKTVPQRVFENFIRVPRQIIPGGKYHFDQCEAWITRLASPFHLLYANLALNFGRSIRLQRLMPRWVRDAFFPTGSRPFYWALRSMNKVGRGCRIHPTAVLEGVEIGDNVTIGANCVIRMSRVGSGTIVEDNVILNYCVIGKDNYFSANNFINLCMTYDEVFLIHGPYQFSIYGKGVAVMAVINCDIRLDNRNIVIPTDRGMVDSRQTLLGLAFGHGSVVGGGNIIAPGRIVPNGLKINPPADTIITKFDKYALP